MKKSVKLSIAMALMMGATAGINTVAPSTASAEISDKFRMEINGVTGYVFNGKQLGGDFQTSKAGVGRSYWNTYTRLQLQYHQDKNTMFQARLHSGYDSIVKNVANSNTSGAYFDQAYLQLKDRKANITYILGKKGAYLGQGLIHNSTGNLTGAQVSFGNWYDPTCLQLMYGNKKDGSNFFAANFTHNIMKPWQLSLTYIDHDKQWTSTKYDQNGNTWDSKYQELHLLSVGSKVKAKEFTVQGEFVKNFSDKVRNGVYENKKNLSQRQNSTRRAWYIEVFTGPTSDMTSGLPLQKPGTSVWSLKYQDVGANAVDSHNTTFYDDARGWRLNYGHTFKKGLSADIAVARMKDKGGNDYNDKHNGEWKTCVVAEVSYKFR
ncbi:hypothetical protein [Selenomonas ruminantium]|uniref:hypothetical protein n=1 Tax=Selenomonas ruminantium TaxID=971 RepID=UPI0026EAFD66|nr:hypothetical protein [Selenomonas ruminantium]